MGITALLGLRLRFCVRFLFFGVEFGVDCTTGCTEVEDVVHFVLLGAFEGLFEVEGSKSESESLEIFDSKSKRCLGFFLRHREG